MAGKKGGLGRGLDSLFGDSSILSTPAPIEEKKPASTSKKESPAKTSAAAKKTQSAKSTFAVPKKQGQNAAAKQTSSKTAQDKDVQKNVQEAAESVVYLKLNDIKPNESQPRKVFKEDALADLAASIKENGVIQPVLVRPAAKGYELVAGERRWRAARLAGLKQIPAIIRALDEKTNALYALIENVQREDLNAIEEAQGISEIIEKYGLTQEETAKVVGKSRPYVSNALRLLKLPKEVKELVESGVLSMGHARAVAGLEGEALQVEAAKKAAAEGWSVRQIESYTARAPRKKAPAKKKAKAKDAETRALEDKLSENLGTRVVVEGGAKKGRLIIDYYSADELDRLVEIMSKQ